MLFRSDLRKECSGRMATLSTKVREVQLMQDLAVGVEGLLKLERAILGIRRCGLGLVRLRERRVDLVALVHVAGVETVVVRLNRLGRDAIEGVLGLGEVPDGKRHAFDPLACCDDRLARPIR